MRTAGMGVARSLAACLVIAAGASAQVASSPTYFFVAGEQAPGTNSSSVTYRLAGAQGAGVVPGRAVSPTYVLQGGFVAALDAPTTGRPWLAAVRPLYAPLKGGTSLNLSGTELHIGPAAVVKVGGLTATVLSRTRDRIQAVLPAQPAPGWRPVQVSAGGASSALPRGIGILPMLDLERPALPLVPFEVSYRGSQGDLVIWLVAAGNGPFPLPLPGYGHGLELDLATLLVVTASVVTDPGGEQRLPLPAVAWVRPLHFQALAVSTNAGYAPGSFTNVVKL